MKPPLCLLLALRHTLGLCCEVETVLTQAPQK